MWTWESIRPGIAVMPPASITTSAASTACAEAVPTETMRSPSVRMASPRPSGLCQSPVTICPILTIAVFIARPSCPHSVRGQRGGKIVACHGVVHHLGRARPVERAVAVAGGDEARARVEHLVLRVARAELRADRVPGELQELDLLLGL